MKVLSFLAARFGRVRGETPAGLIKASDAAMALTGRAMS
jgi:hypothetical protein